MIAFLLIAFCNLEIIHHWNDQRSRRVFICFFSAIFKLTSVKFQTFAGNSRTVKSSYMKFKQQFEINEMYVCIKFRVNYFCDFGFKNRKPPRKLGVKTGFIQKQLKHGKKYFTWLDVLRYPFIPIYPFLAAMRFFSFFVVVFFPFWDFRDASCRKSLCFVFFLANLRIRQPYTKISRSSKRLKVET